MPKEDPGTNVLKSDYFKAMETWDRFWMEENGYIHQEYHKFLGLTKGFKKMVFHHSHVKERSLQIRRSAVQKIAMLNSPHAHALLKAYKAKYQISPITHYLKLMKEGKI